MAQAPLRPPQATPGELSRTGTRLSGTELLVNGDFSRRSERWRLERTPGGAEADLEWLEGQTPPGIAGKVARVSVRKVGARPWHVQFFQSGLTLTDGEPYTLVFWARSDRERPFSVAANVDSGDGRAIGLTAERLTLAHHWRKFTLVFNALHPEDAHNRICFILGGSVGTVDLSGVSLRAGIPGVPEGPNLMVAQDGAVSGSQWVLEKGAGGSAASLQWVDVDGTPPGVRGKVARVQVERVGEEKWHVQLIQSGLDLREGVPHVLTFWARAEQPRPISLDAIHDKPEWHPLGLSGRVDLTPEWQRFTRGFTPTGTVANRSRLAFILGQTTGTVELAGFALRRRRIGTATTTSRPPAVHPMVGTWESRNSDPSKSYAFCFNADGTGSLRTGLAARSTTTPPRAPVVNPYRWYLSKDEGKVVIAQRTYDWSVSAEGSEEKLVLGTTKGKSHVLFRRR